MIFPKEFEKRMIEYLGEEYQDFRNSYSEKPEKGVRINPLKADFENIKDCFKDLVSTKFSPLCLSTDMEKLGTMPMHSAGAFYSQEPSASSAVTILNPKQGDKVLDLCAAPGGKSTQIAGLLNGTGLLWSNEIVRNRANILLSNIERMGIKNAVVSSCYPEVLCNKLAGFFDKVLVDAPCSGEGMFRKNHDAMEQWSLEHVKACAIRQISILNSAAICVKEGGVLVYSTCTFSKEENEDVCNAFLENNKEFILENPNVDFGRKAMGINAIRIYPMDGGEGHFVAKFKRISPNEKYPKEFTYPSENKEATAFYNEIFKDEIFGKVINIKNKLIVLPENLPDIKGLQVLRAGVELGEIKGKRIEPSHNIFTVQKMENCKNCIDLEYNSKEIYKYLHGEEISCDLKGYTAVSVNSVVLGFGKSSGGMLKNKYPKGLRFL